MIASLPNLDLTQTHPSTEFEWGRTENQLRRGQLQAAIQREQASSD